jgi:pimeloyl-ACP methyl ester carboxylesterase
MSFSGENRPESALGAAVNAIRAKPAMMIYGMKDRVLLPHHFIPVFRAAFPDAPVHELVHAGHFLQEDAPETVAFLVRQFALTT